MVSFSCKSPPGLWERRMTLEVSTPALHFPAISLLFLTYPNRFLHLSALIRKLHREKKL